MRRFDFLVIALLSFGITISFGFLIILNAEDSYQKEINELATVLAEDHRKAKLLGVISTLATVDSDVIATATNTLPPDNPQTMKKLKYIFDKLDLDNMMIMAKDGTVNGYLVRNVSTTITGKNFAWRPYFSGPMNRVDTSYAAFGSNSKDRGFYISTPILENNQIEGVMVAKIGFDEVDRAINRFSSPIAVLSPEGVVFASNRSSWLYKVIGDKKSLIDIKQNSRVSNAYKESDPIAVKFNSSSIKEFKSDIEWQDPSGRWSVVGFASWRDFFGIYSGLISFIFFYFVIYLIYKLKEARGEVFVKANQVKRLLDNSKEGFLAFGEDLIVESEYSKACEVMLGVMPAGKDISDLIGSDDKEFMQEVLASVFTTKDKALKINILKLLSTQIKIENRLINIDYRVIEDEKIMVILSDITEKTKIEKQLKIEQKNLKMVVIAVSDTNRFFDAVDSFDMFITSLQKRVDGCKNSKELLQNLYREIHTYKGVLNQLSFGATPDLLNEIEICLSKQMHAIDREKLAICLNLEEIKNQFKEDLEVIAKSLGREFLDQGRTLILTQEQARSLEENLSEIVDGNYDNLKVIKLKELLDEVSKLRKVKISDAIKSFGGMIEQIAVRLNKQIAPIKIVEKAEVFVEIERYRDLIQSLVHIFRNAVTHGIEIPEKRWENGKSVEGHISCTIDRVENKIIVEISDDGAGVDLDALRKNRLIDSADKSDSELLKDIFIEYITTNENPDDLSGRGVGLSAVASEVNKLGGSIDVSSIRGVKTSFTILLPI